MARIAIFPVILRSIVVILRVDVLEDEEQQTTKLNGADGSMKG